MQSHLRCSRSIAVEPLEARRLLSGTGAISGAVYEDLNDNAAHEAGEAGIKKVRVYLDNNNNGAWDKSTEPSTTTDKRGSYAFLKLGAGTYRVRQLVPDGMAPVGPRSGWFKVSLTKGQQVTRRLFADAEMSTIGQSALPTGVVSGSTDFNGTIDLGSTISGGSMSSGINRIGAVGSENVVLIDSAFNRPDGGLLGAAVHLPRIPGG